MFYPAEPGSLGSSFSAAPSEAPYFPFGRDTSDALAGLVYFPTFLLSHLATAKSGCVADAPFASSVESCRTVVYSHGMGGNADMGAYAMRRMAAQGMIVVALEHQDGSASFARDEGGVRVPFDGGRGRGFRHRVGEVIGAARTLRQSLSEPLVSRQCPPLPSLPVIPALLHDQQPRSPVAIALPEQKTGSIIVPPDAAGWSPCGAHLPGAPRGRGPQLRGPDSHGRLPGP